jgi:hypothetical protein
LNRRSFFAALVTTLLVSTASAQQAPAPHVTRVLFIGNSYTYYNNLPELFLGLATAGKQPVEVKMVSSGGWTLNDHWTKGEARQTLTGSRWDFVVIQDQSTLGVNLVIDGVNRVSTDEKFAPAAKWWLEEIQRVGATPVMYLTWARKGAPQDQAMLDYAYVTAASATPAARAIVSPVGRAWKATREQHKGIELFVEDGSHPSPAGSYLAACTFFSAIFDRTPVGLPATISGSAIDPKTDRPDPNRREKLASLSNADAAALQREAWAAWQDVKKQGGRPAVTRPPLPVAAK